MQRAIASSSTSLLVSASQSSYFAQLPRKATSAVLPSAKHFSSNRVAASIATSRSSRRNPGSSSLVSSLSGSLLRIARSQQQNRGFASSAVSQHGGKGRPAPGTGIKVTFKNHKGEEIKTVEANEGDDIVDLSWEYDLDIEAACEKSIACSTCHVILDSETYDKLEEPSDEENDMLDMAFGLEDTSRLGCQVKVTRNMDGMTVTMPSATRNFAVDGHKSKH